MASLGPGITFNEEHKGRKDSLIHYKALAAIIELSTSIPPNSSVPPCIRVK
jgi:hypothetical protein